MAGKRKHPEDDLTIQCADYLRLLQNQGRLMFYHIPNGGKRNVREAARFKAMGVQPGVPDLALMFPDRIAVFVELKAGNGKLNANQIDWQFDARELGFATHVCHNLDELQTIVNAYL